MGYAVGAVALKKSVEDQVLPSGSIIHWSECDQEYVPVTCSGCSTKRPVKIISVLSKRSRFTGLCHECTAKAKREHPFDEVLANDAIVHWSELHQKRVPVTCAKCGRKYTIQARDLSEWTGLCKECWLQEPRKLHRIKKEVLPTGETVDWLKRAPNDQRKVAVTCPHCGKERFLTVTALYGKKGSQRSGLCRKCAHRKHARVEKHRSGTLLLWDDWDSSNKHKFPIKCHGCNEKKLVWYSNINRPNWSGLCSDCAKQQPHPRKDNSKIHLPGGYFDMGKRHPNDSRRVWAVCEPCLKKGVEGRWRRRPNPKILPKTGLCDKHHGDLRSGILLLAHQNGNGQKNGSTGKRKAGRRRAFTDAQAFQAIDNLGARVSVNQLAQSLNCARVTVNDWAHDKGYKNLAELVSARRTGV